MDERTVISVLAGSAGFVSCHVCPAVPYQFEYTLVSFVSVLAVKNVKEVAVGIGERLLFYQVFIHEGEYTRTFR